MSVVNGRAQGIFNLVDVAVCSGCLKAIEKKLSKLEGVEKVRLNYITNKVYVDYDPALVNSAAIRQTIEKAGYRAFEQMRR